ncbi:hypothetical protein [Acinetobacter sp. YH01009]|uniref:hypothetical protein n=1 Tax=Acinetobacter sp. YH01009 TaxID=2601025 RepID=UPI0015D407D8|nr:hypothetical protein [Acinetobacter sp. YH01009]
MNQVVMSEPARTPFNPHGFQDAEPLHAFYLKLLNDGLIIPDLEQGSIEFENSQQFMILDWESVDVDVEGQKYDLKLDISCGVVLIDQKITNKIQLFINNNTLYILSAKTFNPKSGLTQSLNFDIPLRVLSQMGYYALPIKED